MSVNGYGIATRADPESRETRVLWLEGEQETSIHQCLANKQCCDASRLRYRPHDTTWQGTSYRSALAGSFPSKKRAMPT